MPTSQNLKSPELSGFHRYKFFYSALCAIPQPIRICLKTLVGPLGFEPRTKGL